MTAAAVFSLSRFSRIECCVRLVLVFISFYAIFHADLPTWAKGSLFSCVLYYLLLSFISRLESTLTFMGKGCWKYGKQIWRVSDYQLLLFGRLLVIQFRALKNNRKKILWLWPDNLNKKAFSELSYLLFVNAKEDNE